MTQEELNSNPVNGSIAEFDCPMCGKHRAGGVKCLWYDRKSVPEGGMEAPFICLYVICRKCLKMIVDATRDQQIVFVEQCEQTLLQEHPELWDRIPDNYFTEPEGTTP